MGTEDQPGHINGHVVMSFERGRKGNKIKVINNFCAVTARFMSLFHCVTVQCFFKMMVDKGVGVLFPILSSKHFNKGFFYEECHVSLCFVWLTYKAINI